MRRKLSLSSTELLTAGFFSSGARTAFALAGDGAIISLDSHGKTIRPVERRFRFDLPGDIEDRG